MIYSYISEGKATSKQLHNIDFEEVYDVIVAGLGTAGSFAAISCAKEGIHILGVEKLSGMGGMSTFGGVDGYYFGSVGGMRIEVDKQICNITKNNFVKQNAREVKAYVLESKAETYGADLIFEARVIGVFLEDKTIKGISILTNDGIRNFGCRILIDATADAEVCFMAGCETRIGREIDGKMLPFSSVRYFISDDYTIGRTNYDSGFVNQFDPKELSNAIIASNSNHMLEEFEFSDIKFNVGDGKENFLFLTPYVGIREGRLINAEYNITSKAILDESIDKKPLFYAFADFDKHGKDHAMESEALQDFIVASNLSTVNISVPVPFESLLPKGYQGLIAAGRHIGMDHETACLIRMVADMQICGEAAGVAASMCLKKNLPLTQAPYDEIIDKLKHNECFSEKHNIGYSINEDGINTVISWLTDPSEIMQNLSTDKPGIAIWSCKRQKEKMMPYLLEGMHSPNQMLRYNVAIALGVMDESASVDILLNIVKNEPVKKRTC